MDARTVDFTDLGGEKVAALQVAVFAGSRGQDLLGEQSDAIDLRLGPEAYERVLREGYRHTVHVPVTREPHHLKAVVYDFLGDRVGSAVRQIR